MSLLLGLGALVAIAVMSHLATTTKEERREQQKEFDRKTRWVWIPVIILLALLLWP